MFLSKNQICREMDSTTHIPPKKLSFGFRALQRLCGLSRRLGIQKDLSVTDLRRAASRSTGLTDWGDDPLADLFESLVTSLESDGNLTPLGRAIAKQGLIRLLKARLYIQRELAARPDITQREIRRPIIVAALPRTGTTLLHNLLSLSEDGRPLLLWETMTPARSGRRLSDPDRRLERARQQVAFLNRWLPTMATMHEISADGPEECSQILAYSYLIPLPADSLISGYRSRLDRLTDAELDLMYQYHRAQLQILQGDSSPRWILKGIAHLIGMGSLLGTYPDACVIQTHRDPCKVVPSVCSLQHLFVEPMFRNLAGYGEAVASSLADRLRRGLEGRDRFPAERVFDLAYEDLVAHPLESLQQIHDHFGLEFTPRHRQRCEQWLAANPRHKHGVHKYSLEQFGLTEQRIDELYGFYTDRFLRSAPKRSASTVGA
jgi:hypothetical protein